MQRKKENFLHRFCPKCGSPKIKNWDDLTADEKFMVERLPLSSEYTPEERKRNLFCTRCFYEEKNAEIKQA